MPAPIRVAWFNRPGWGEYGAWRVHGSHQGYDSYCAPYSTIYGTAEGGRVIGKGYAAGGWGHWVDVRYPKQGSRPAYVQRDAHMAEASPLGWLAKVGTGTKVGRVGRTGNAKSIVWWRNGKELWHVHSEVYLATFVLFRKRTNPLSIWGATTAGNNIIPIIIPDPDYEQDDTMILINIADGDGRYGKKNAVYYALVTGDGRKIPVSVPFASKLRYAHGERDTDGKPTGSAYVVAYADWEAFDTAPVVGGSTDLAPVLTAVSKIPTAEQNGQAARAAIVAPK